MHCLLGLYMYVARLVERVMVGFDAYLSDGSFLPPWASTGTLSAARRSSAGRWCASRLCATRIPNAYIPCYGIQIFYFANRYFLLFALIGM